jgi:hypothetical protein
MLSLIASPFLTLTGPTVTRLGTIGAMSVTVSLDRLRAEVARFGSSPYLLTVTADGRPHAVAVTVAWQGDSLVTGAGSKTVANVAERPAVTLLWPALVARGYSLIVDGIAGTGTGIGTGTGTSTASGSAARLTVQPTKAVLHRQKADGPGSDCVAVLPG